MGPMSHRFFHMFLANFGFSIYKHVFVVAKSELIEIPSVGPNVLEYSTFFS